MNALTALLDKLASEGLRLDLLEGERIAVTPKDRLTSDLRDAILRNRGEVLELLRLHGSGLLDLFRASPVWPPPRGRLQALEPFWWRSIGSPVRLADSREGVLAFISYDTRSGRVRFRVEFPNGWVLVDPEDAARLPRQDRRTA